MPTNIDKARSATVHACVLSAIISLAAYSCSLCGVSVNFLSVTSVALIAAFTSVFLKTRFILARRLLRRIICIIRIARDPENMASVGPNQKARLMSIKSIKRVLKSDSIERPMGEAFFFRAVMGRGFYSRGFLMDAFRTDAMQKVKANAVGAQKRRIEKNLSAQMHTTLNFDWDAFLTTHDVEKEGLQALVYAITRVVEKRLLNLPEGLDFAQVGEITSCSPELIDAMKEKGIWETVKCLLLGRRIVAPDSKLTRAQLYLRDFIYAADWPEDCYCTDVIKAGEANGVDARGCLAELLTGASYNIANVLSVLAWSSLHGEDGEIMVSEIKAACAQGQHLTDKEFISAAAGGHGSGGGGGGGVLKWVHWVLMKYPNLHTVARSDENGELLLVDLVDLNTEAGTFSEAATFSSGRFGCPGATLAVTTMVLVLRYLFSPCAKHQLVYSKGGELHATHDGVAGKLDVSWTDDSVPLE